MKCASRGLECPGFKAVYLKWNQGIASRGKLAGKLVPTTKGPKSHTRAGSCTQLRCHQITKSDGTRPGGIPGPASRRHQCGAIPPSQNDSANSAIRPLDQIEYSRIVAPFWTSSIFESLYNHFCTKAISRLTWIDQPSHPLRTIVQQLLRHSACVRFSVGSLAAAHMSMVPNKPRDQSRALFQLYASLRDESLRVLSTKMRSGLPSHSSGALRPAAQFKITEILACMLVLCYTEVLVPGSKVWRVHLRGCRTVIDLRPLEHWVTASTDPVIKFLLKEISDLEMLTGISAFHQESTSTPTPSLQSDWADTGWAFTKLIYTITALERKRHCLRKANTRIPNIDMNVWFGRAEEARVRSMACTDCLNDTQKHLRESFHAVARAHYYATVIYCYQAFKTSDEKRTTLPELLEPLLRDVHFVMAGPTDELFHDLFFPLFIAGIESASNTQRQSEINGLFLESLSRTGVWCNFSALQFLRTFWSTSSTLGTTLNWMDFARENLSSIEHFIVF